MNASLRGSGDVSTEFAFLQGLQDTRKRKSRDQAGMFTRAIQKFKCEQPFLGRGVFTVY